MVIPAWSRRVVAGLVMTIGALLLATSRVGERNSSETIAIATLQTIIWEETSYADLNGGYFDTLTCLHTRGCTSADTRRASSLPANLMDRNGWRGYRFQFHPGPAAVIAKGEPWSPTSMMGFAVVATPVKVTPTSRRSFCMDDRSVIYEQESSAPPQVSDARCVDTSRPVK